MKSESILKFLVFVMGVWAIMSGIIVAQTPLQLPDTDWRTDWAKTSIDLSELEASVARDAIPSIDHPRFVSVSEAEQWVGDNEPVILVELDSAARAYPLQVLMWHEIVNDRIGDTPIVVTFCPLCYSALVFKRSIRGAEYHFGVSGMLRYSDLVMFDRETHSLWQQLSGDAIVGTFAGTVLEQIPAQIISFNQFKSAFPDGLVLSKETGFNRSYGRNPYKGYDNINERPWLFSGPFDDRLPPMEKVVGVSTPTTQKAYPHSITRKQGVISDEIDGQPIVVFHTEKGATSALDRSSIDKSRNIGSTGVYSSVLPNGQLLTFIRTKDQFVDRQTGSTWNITGMAVEGQLKGTRLQSIPHGDIFSFAWFVIHPNSQLYR
ncbi:MAG: DUF3179 domain-containing protein [Bacteroidetes bacterium]|nr:DUF3179 domain-containing protein [Bacteroidota bacterium]